MIETAARGVNRRIITVEFGDCDPARIVYYPNYFRWFDQSTHHLFASAGFPLLQLTQTRGLTIPLVNASSEFSGPAVWGDTLAIESRITRWGTRAFDVAHTITQAETGAAILRGSETRVCVQLDPNDPRGIRGVSIPDDIRTALGG
jgi:4-hydroxybenzoyl-CoA thioesterase